MARAEDSITPHDSRELSGYWQLAVFVGCLAFLRICMWLAFESNLQNWFVRPKPIWMVFLVGPICIGSGYLAARLTLGRMNDFVVVLVGFCAGVVVSLPVSFGLGVVGGMVGVCIARSQRFCNLALSLLKGVALACTWMIPGLLVGFATASLQESSPKTAQNQLAIIGFSAAYVLAFILSWRRRRQTSQKNNSKIGGLGWLNVAVMTLLVTAMSFVFGLEIRNRLVCWRLQPYIWTASELNPWEKWMTRGLTNVFQVGLHKSIAIDLDWLRRFSVREFYSHSSHLTDDDVRNLEGMDELAWLYVNGGNINDGLAKVLTLPNLVEVNLEGLPVDDRVFDYLEGNTYLQALRLSSSKVFGNGIEKLCTTKALRVLCLNDTNIDDYDLPKLPKTLGQLELGNTCVSDAGLKHLASPTLMALNLNENKISGTELGRLIAGTPNLTEIRLDGTPLSDSDIASLVKLPFLQKVSFVGTNISDRAAQGIVNLANVRIDAWNLTQATVAKFEQSGNLFELFVSDRVLDQFELTRLASFGVEIQFLRCTLDDAAIESIRRLNFTKGVDFVFMETKVTPQQRSQLENVSGVTVVYEADD